MEHAYTAWVKTFDESGTFKLRKPEGQALSIVHPGRWIAGLLVCFFIMMFAVLSQSLSCLRWIGLAVLVELITREVVELLWWKTRLRTIVKGVLKRRGWW